MLAKSLAACALEVSISLESPDSVPYLSLRFSVAVPTQKMYIFVSTEIHVAILIRRNMMGAMGIREPDTKRNVTEHLQIPSRKTDNVLKGLEMFELIFDSITMVLW